MTAVQQNLNVWANDFTQGRTGANFAASVAGTGPDGTAASLLNDGVAVGVQHYIYQTLGWTSKAGDVVSYSFCAKAGTGQYLKLDVDGSRRAIFDVLNGALGSVDSSLIATIKPMYDSAGALWGYRCRVTFTATMVGATVLYLMAAATSSDAYAATFNGANRTYTLWCEQRVMANWEGPLCPTFAKPCDNGPIRSVAAAVQNFIIQSDAIGTAPWTTNNVGSTTPGQLDPWGGNTAKLFTDTVDGGAVAHYYRQSVVNGLIPTKTLATRVYAKPGTKFKFSFWEASTGASVEFNMQTGVVTYSGAATSTTKSGVIYPAGNGYSRCECLWLPGALTGTSFVIQPYGDAAAFNFQGDGTGTMSFSRVQIAQANWAGNECPTSTTGIGTTTPIRNLA